MLIMVVSFSVFIHVVIITVFSWTLPLLHRYKVLNKNMHTYNLLMHW